MTRSGRTRPDGTHAEEVRFDGPAVCAVAACLSSSAIAAEDDTRALGSVEFGEHTVGVRYRTHGSAIELGYLALRRSLEEWAAGAEMLSGRLVAAGSDYARAVDTAAEAFGAAGERWIP